MSADRSSSLLRRGLRLEYVTLGWNVVGIVVLGVAAVTARSVALAGFGLDSLIEIGASTVVVWELSGANPERERRALRMIGIAFLALAVYLTIQAAVVLAVHHHAAHSPLGIAWTAATALIMFGLAIGKARTGRALNNPVLLSEGRVTLVDGLLATAILAGLVLNAALGWWWADPLAGLEFAEQVLPSPISVAVAHIVRETGLSRRYGRDIVTVAKVPHPMHWALCLSRPRVARAHERLHVPL